MEFEGPAKDLRQFLGALRRRRELVEIEAPVDPVLEVAEIHRRVAAADGPALWFRRVEGSPFSLVTNLFGSIGRVEAAFGPEPRELLEPLVQVLQSSPPPGPWQLLRSPQVRRAVRAGVRIRSRGPVLECRQPTVDLSALPLTKSWPEDGGDFLTLPLVLTEHPEPWRQQSRYLPDATI